MAKIDESLQKIVLRELGKNSADLFVQFYDGFSYEEQLAGVREVLNFTVGKKRATELLKDYNKSRPI